jgi:epoxyqueuosine reductase
MTVDLLDVRQNIKTEAKHLGFTHIGIAPSNPAPHYRQYLNWIEKGMQADMDYLSRQDATVKRGDPQQVLAGCKRIICLAMPYQRPQPALDSIPPGRGRISAYARTMDYHDVILDKLRQLENAIRQFAEGEVRLKSYVDTGPILERSYASLAGIGISGKNSCLLIQGAGSFFFLAEILTDLELPIDEPFTRDLCGTCQRCIDACPTQCILPDRTINAGRCISYLTIENRKEIPHDLKEKLGDWVFGCDICQIVCPHNTHMANKITKLGEPLLPEFLGLIELFSYDEEGFTGRFGQTPLARAKRTGTLRNAAVVLGNQKCAAALPALKHALENEGNPAVQDACRWAIGQINHASPSYPEKG